MASPTDNHFETGRSGKHATMHRSHSLQSQVTLQNGLYFAAALRSHVASQGVIEAGTDRKRNSQRASRYLSQELDSAGARIPLALCCFLSGFVACVSFSACSIWTGFQSGNSVQVFMALGRLTYDPHPGRQLFYTSDYQALCSILSFAIAAQIGGRLSPWKRKARVTIALSALAQCLFTAGAAVTAYYCNEPAFVLNRAAPSWHNAFGFATIGLSSAAMGLQGVVGETFGTGYTATVVLTSIWIQLAVLPWPKKWSRPRDDRLSAIALFGLGAYISRLLLARIGSGGTLGIAAGVRFLVLLIWLLHCPAAPTVEEHMSCTDKMPALGLQSNDSRATMVP